MEIQTANQTADVKVDANTGKILKSEKDSEERDSDKQDNDNSEQENENGDSTGLDN